MEFPATMIQEVLPPRVAGHRDHRIPVMVIVVRNVNSCVRVHWGCCSWWCVGVIFGTR